MQRKTYPSDLSDQQWAVLQPLLPAARPGGRPRATDLRELVNALFYLAREGCSWRAIPHDFGIPWKTVYNYFRDWTADGTWQELQDALRWQVRLTAGRDEAHTRYNDSPAVKTAHRGPERGD